MMERSGKKSNRSKRAIRKEALKAEAPKLAKAADVLPGKTMQTTGVTAMAGKHPVVRFLRSHISIYTVAMLAIIAVMLYIRIALPYNAVFTNWPGNYVNVAADDAPEQMRMVYNTIAHFPDREMYDPFTHFPYGSMIHFGPLFTLMIASASILIGLGHPGSQLIAAVGAYFPAVLGALCAIPTYYIGKRLFGRNAGLLAAAILMLLPGQFLIRSLLGFTDHHVAEVLFSATTIAFLVYALDAAKRSGLSLEQIKHRDVNALKWPLLYSALAGIAFGCYLLSWTGALLIGFMLFVYFTIQCIFDHLRGRSPDSTLIIAAFIYLVPAVMVLPYSITYPHLDLVLYSLTQPVIMSLAFLGVAMMYAISRLMDQGKLSKWAYPVVLAGITVAGILFVYVAMPQLYGLIMAGLGKFTAGGSALTIGEALPTYTNMAGQLSLENFWEDFNWNFYISFLALLLLAYRVYRGDSPGVLMFLIWNVTMLWATFTEVRFTYYFAVNAALLTAYFATEVFDRLGARQFKENFMKRVRSPGDLPKFIGQYKWQTAAISLMAVLFMLVAIWPATGLDSNFPDITWQEAQGGPGGMPYEWFDALTWMKAHTPDPQGSSVQASFDYANGHYAVPQNYGSDRYDYPSSAYGVMSWWDYGHDIEYVANRIPDANPFQAGVIEQNGTTGAAPFFTSTDEANSTRMLDALDTRYVIINNRMAGEIFSIIQEWTNDTLGWETVGQSRYAFMDEAQGSLMGTNSPVPVLQDTDKWNNSTMNRLYYDDASGMGHYRLVYESAGPYYINMKQIKDGHSDRVQTYFIDNLTKAEGTYKLYNTYAVGKDQQATQYLYDARPPEKYVKIFEKVDGATLVGSAPDGVMVTALLTLKTDWGREFNYMASGVATNGKYSIVVSYPTEQMKGDGYSYGILPEGSYTISYGNATKTVGVSEHAVMTGETVQVQ